MKTLTTVNDVIRFFGGPSKTAKWAGCTDNAVCLWRKRGIPPAVHLRLLIEAQKSGVRLGPEVLKMREDEWDELYEMVGPTRLEQVSASS